MIEKTEENNEYENYLDCEVDLAEKIQNNNNENNNNDNDNVNKKALVEDTFSNTTGDDSTTVGSSSLPTSSRINDDKDVKDNVVNVNVLDSNDNVSYQHNRKNRKLNKHYLIREAILCQEYCSRGKISSIHIKLSTSLHQTFNFS